MPTQKRSDRGGEVAAARRHLGLSQAELAQVIGVQAVTVGRWESGRGAPGPWYRAVLRRMAGAPQAGRAGMDAAEVLAEFGPVGALWVFLPSAAARSESCRAVRASVDPSSSMSRSRARPRSR